MDPARYARIQDLFHAAVDLDPAQRPAFLAVECADDPALASAVSAMLKEDACDSGLLDGSVSDVAISLTGGIPTAFLAQPFGPYRLVRPLGEGGMGVVYLAYRSDLDSQAAIKILRDASLSPARRERFLSEQRTLAQLQHPSIARLYDADTLPDGTPWFAMEFVEGIPLTDYTVSLPSIEDRLRLIRTVCEAVQYAHSQAVIHRDLKPSNILVTPDGRAKLLDFGIAKHLDALEEAHTRTGLRMMTPAYAAPEQIRAQPVGTYTDVYSLGVLIYEVVSGKLPFDLSDRSPGEAESLLLESSPAKLSLDGDLEVLCQTAMHRDAERRYRSAEALIRDIDHYLKNEPLEAQPDSLAYRLVKFTRRHRRAVIAATLVVVVLAALTAFYAFRITAARNAAVAEAARAQRIMGFLVDLFQGGDQESGPANDLRVVTLIDRGVESANRLTQDPAAQAELHRTLGGVYQKLGNLEKAEGLLQAALNRRTALFGTASTSVAESMTDLALLRIEQARLDDAEKFARAGLSLSKNLYPPAHPAIAVSTEALGKVLEEKGDYPQAIQVLEEAIRLRSAANAQPELANALFELSNTHFYAGNWDKSADLARRSMAIHTTVYGPRHPLVAGDLVNLGAIEQEKGRYKEAEAFHRQALEITQSFYGPDHPRTAAGLTMIARVLVLQKKRDEAITILDRALVIRERAFGALHPSVASTLNEMGNIALIDTRFDEAEKHFRRIVDIYRKTYNGKHYLIGIGLSNLGSVFMNSKRFPEAEPYYREAIAMFTATLPPTHLNTGIARIKLGRTLLRQKRYQDAESSIKAGYDILAAQTSPAVSWLQNARQDLAEVYDALGNSVQAQKFRTEREAAAKSSK